jgi:hypothetical protein
MVFAVRQPKNAKYSVLEGSNLAEERVESSVTKFATLFVTLDFSESMRTAEPLNRRVLDQ